MESKYIVGKNLISYENGYVGISNEKVKPGDLVYSVRGVIYKFGEFENSYAEECFKILFLSNNIRCINNHDLFHEFNISTIDINEFVNMNFDENDIDWINGNIFEKHQVEKIMELSREFSCFEANTLYPNLKYSYTLEDIINSVKPKLQYIEVFLQCEDGLSEENCNCFRRKIKLFHNQVMIKDVRFE